MKKCENCRQAEKSGGCDNEHCMLAAEIKKRLCDWSLAFIINIQLIMAFSMGTIGGVLLIEEGYHFIFLAYAVWIIFTFFSFMFFEEIKSFITIRTARRFSTTHQKKETKL